MTCSNDRRNWRAAVSFLVLEGEAKRPAFIALARPPASRGERRNRGELPRVASHPHSPS
jgi:hypothetical protein